MVNERFLLYDHQSSIDEELILNIFNFDNNHFPYPWSIENWTNFFNGKRHFVLCTLLNPDLCGFSLFSIDLVDGNTELLKICIDSCFHGSGLSSRLFKESLSYVNKKYELRSVYLDVSASNTRAINFYEKLGFCKVRHQKKFYSDLNDAHGMILHCDDSIKKSMLTE